MTAASSGTGTWIGTAGVSMMTEGYPPVAGGAFPESPRGASAGGGAPPSGAPQAASAKRHRTAHGCRILETMFVIITQGRITMAQFMLLLHENPSDFTGLGPQELKKIIEEYRGWRQDMTATGRLIAGQKLKDEGGRHLSARGREVLVTDGPFAEAKEVLGGYFLVNASSYDEAVEIAKQCPHLRYNGRIEIRQIDLME